MVKKICIYTRVSTKSQDLQIQKDEILKYCKFKEYEIIAMYEDKASGKNIERTGFQKMQKDLEVNPLGIEALIVWKLDRLGRSIRDLINITDFLQKHNIGFIAISNNIDTTTKEGRLFFYMMSAIAEYERELILERTTLGRDAAIENGAIIGRPEKDIDMENVKKLLSQGISKVRIAKDLKIHRTTLDKKLKEGKEK